MIDWEAFDKLIVVRKMKDVIGKWWNIQLNFTDPKGYLRGVPDGKFFNPLNEVCKKVVQREDGFKRCIFTARNATIDAINRTSSRIFKDHIGLSAISLPVRFDNNFLGCVYADGFIIADGAQETISLIKKNVSMMYPEIDQDWLDKYLTDFPTLKQDDIDYLVELIEVVTEEMINVTRNLAEQTQQVSNLTNELTGRYSFHHMVGKSNVMQDIYKLLDKVSATDSTILISGDNGTGKELIAKALHYNSLRKEKTFVTQNCSAFNDNLLDSELFGHVKGAFTGATRDKKGLFEMAHGGTLFLDEVGDTSPAMQVKLLRVLQEGTFLPVGGTQVKKVDVRMIAATNKNLRELIDTGQFREDLYYRLNVIHIHVPSLKERREDIPLLIDHFLKHYAAKSNKPIHTIPTEVMEYLMNFEWPGNVRELENEIERLCVLSENTEISKEILSPKIFGETSSGNIAGTTGPTTPAISTPPGVVRKLKDALEEVERQLIKEGLERTNFNKSKLARELGISRAGLIMKVEKYELDKRQQNQ